MKTTLTLVLEVEHPNDFDPAQHFVWYFSDDYYGVDFDPSEDVMVLEETWK